MRFLEPMMTFIKKDPRMLVQLVIRFSVISEFDYSVLKVIEFKPFSLLFELSPSSPSGHVMRPSSSCFQIAHNF